MPFRRPWSPALSFASNTHMSLILDSIKSATWLHVLLSSQFWPMWSKSRQGLDQLPIRRTTLFG